MTYKQLSNERKECKKQLRKRIKKSMPFSMDQHSDKSLQYAAEENYKEILRLTNMILELDERISKLPKNNLFQRFKKTLEL